MVSQANESRGLRQVLSSVFQWTSQQHGNIDKTTKTVESYRPGYPRFSALIAGHESLHVARRFTIIRTRLLLQKQHRLAELESKLNQIDVQERRPLFLGSYRMDKNSERKQILSDIDIALSDYDNLVERNFRNRQIQTARERDILSLQNWVKGNACLARQDTEYLEHIDDLMGLGGSHDDAFIQVRTMIENILIRFFRRSYKKLCMEVSRDQEVFIPPRSLLNQWVRAVLVLIILLFLLVPVVVCYCSHNILSRLFVVIVSVTVFVGTLSTLTKARMVEVFVASAAYTTVLTVFVTTAGNAK